MEIKLKKYIHFTSKFSRKDIPFIKRYINDKNNIERHKFFPFIHYTIVENKFKRHYRDDGSREERRSSKKKKREIYYANHLDAQVYSYYAHLLSQKLEGIYAHNSELNECVIGYRKIPINEQRNKCNIDFAKEVFDYIRNSTHENLSVYCIDVSNFFDTIDHKILKKSWSKILGQKCLPDDHYKVYKSIINFSYVEIVDLIEEFSELNIKKLKYLKSRDKINSFCKNGVEFRERVKEKGLIRYNGDKNRGIPQGSPISSVLSNLYMVEFDTIFSEKINAIGGLYRRYSDDIIFVSSYESADELHSFVKHYISDTLLLEIQPEKTQIVHFRRDSSGAIEWRSFEKELKVNRPLSYLGFDFDGNKIFIRQKSLAKYYRRVKKLIRRKAAYAFFAKKHNLYNAKKKDAWIYRRKIYKTKSHLGSKRKRINNIVHWGNYYSYVMTASKIMNEPAIKRQLRNHWRTIERLIRVYEKKYGLQKSPSVRKRSSNQ